MSQPHLTSSTEQFCSTYACKPSHYRSHGTLVMSQVVLLFLCLVLALEDKFQGPRSNVSISVLLCDFELLI